MSKVLVVAPHPDDEVLGCGGTIAKHVHSGNEVHLCVVTQVYEPDWPAEDLKLRKAEVLAANKVLGITQTHFLGFPTARLDTVPRKDLIGAIQRVAQAVRPEVIYLPHRGDANRDHAAVFDAATIVFRPSPDASTKQVLVYETLSETDWAPAVADEAFIPTLFVNITGFLETKLKAMSEYETELREFPHPRSLEAITALAKVRGVRSGNPAAEAFMVLRELWD